MRTLRDRLQESSTVGQATEVLCEELGAVRASLARLDRVSDTFEIVASAGADMLAPHVALPIELSTPALKAVRQTFYAVSSFDDEPDWTRPVDRLQVAVGFESCCSRIIGPTAHPLGIVSLSFGERDHLVGERVAALTDVADLLVEQLRAAQQKMSALVCHDDEVVAEGVVNLLQRRLGLAAESCRSAEDAVRLAKKASFGVFVCGNYVEGRPASALCADVRAAGAAAPVIIVSRRDTAQDRRAAAMMGAAGYAVLQGAGPSVVEAAAAVCAGRTALLPPPPASEGQSLTQREADVLLDLDDGLRFKEIAARRGISANTAKSYGRSLFRKLGVHSRTEAVNVARERGLLDSLRHAEQSEGWTPQALTA